MMATKHNNIETLRQQVVIDSQQNKHSYNFVQKISAQGLIFTNGDKMSIWDSFAEIVIIFFKK